MLGRSNSSAVIKSAPLPTTFYAIDSDSPTIRAYPRSRFHAWSALSAALANHYGADPERIHTAEAYWNGDREFAEVVTLDGRIVGAVDRPISSADVAAIGRAGLMEKESFINRIRSLFNIDGYTLPELTREQQLEFLRDPVRYFLNTDEAQSDAIMREVESRQKGEVADLRSDFSSRAVVDHLAERSPAKELKDNGESKAAKKPPAAKAPKAKKAKPRVEGQRELLLPIPGKKGEEKPAQAPASRRKAG
jgi:hypothetical protein